MTISPLNISDTFQTWFNKTNTIISEINGITVHNILAGDGIGITSSNNIFTINHGSNVATGVTFTGAVKFTNTVSFSSSPSIDSLIVGVSPKPAGITIGNVVRITNTGLTLAKADTAENAEVLGVVVGSDSTSFTVATAGSINNKNFASTIPNILGSAGATLNIGCAYFLSPTVAGGITTVEPNTYGQVSKPLILGISGDVGSILLHRGIQIDGISAGITAELDNKVIIEVDYSGNVHGVPITTRCTNLNRPQYPVTVGTPVWVIPTTTGDLDASLEVNIWDLGHAHMFGRINGSNSFLAAFTDTSDGWGVAANASPQKTLYGLISKILVNDTVNKKWIFEITKPGGSFLATYNELQHPTIGFYNPSILNGGPYFLAARTDDGSTAGFFQNLMYCVHTWPTQQFASATYDGLNYLQVTPIGDANNTLNIYLEPLAPRHHVVYVSSYSDGINYGSCAISNIIDITTTFGGKKISPFVSSTVASSGGFTGSLEYDNILPNGSFAIWQRGFSGLSGATFAGLSGYYTPIADRWFYVADSGNLTGLTFSVQRQEFAADQVVVPGSPSYWVDVKQVYSGVTDVNYRPRFENVQKGARLLQGQEATFTFWAMAGVCGATVDIVYNRYPENTTYGTVNDASNAIAGRETIVSGLQIGSAWDQYSVSFTPTAQTVVSNSDEGWFTIGFEFPSSTSGFSIAQTKLELGSDLAEFLYVRPEQEVERCSPYYLRTYDWDQTTGFTGTSRLNEHYLTLGNLLSQKTYDVKFPTQLVKSPTVTLYSTTGVVNEAFNVTKNTDMRFPRCEGCPIHVNLPWDTSTVRTSLPSGNITVTNATKNGMQVTINNGATHLDTLKFHYVADADFKVTT